MRVSKKRPLTPMYVIFFYVRVEIRHWWKLTDF